MSNPQWNGPIATQTVVFRGTSTVDIVKNFPAFPNSRAIAGAVYALNVAGGVSGTFSVLVLGTIGGVTFAIAGHTAVAAAGKIILYPTTYTTGGAEQQPNQAVAAGTRQLIEHVPPTQVAFQSVVATAGISAHCTVTACLRGPF